MPIPFADWFPLLMVGGAFTTIGFLKVFGIWHNIVGGGGRPLTCRLLGSCPTWSKHLNVIVMLLFLGIGLSFLSILSWLFLTAGSR